MGKDLHQIPQVGTSLSPLHLAKDRFSEALLEPDTQGLWERDGARSLGELPSS